MEDFIKQLSKDFPDLSFSPGKSFSWSPRSHEIIYKVRAKLNSASKWAILHEIGHAQLKHFSYASDFELLKLEVAAWHRAQAVAKAYSESINEDHIQNCLDTYREWLHRRSTCPVCSNRSLQADSHHYRCFNCHTTWRVSTSRFCRPYRQLAMENEKSPQFSTEAIFS